MRTWHYYTNKPIPSLYDEYRQWRQSKCVLSSSGLSESSSWQYEINQAITDQVKDLITLQTGIIPTSVEQMLGFYEIKNNQRNILSLALSNYMYHFHAAHGMTYIKSLTFDLIMKN